MEKLTHIAFGDSAAGTLKHYFANIAAQQEEVISFREDHSTGPLYEIDRVEGLHQRTEWFKNMFQTICIDEYFNDVDKEFFQSYENIKNIAPDAPVVIWHGENAADQTGLRYLSSQMSGRTLYEINVSESNIEDSRGMTYKPRALAECSPENIESIIATIKPMDKTRCLQLASDWAVLRESKETLRVFKQDKVISVSENYYDDAIISSCGYNFKRAARVIGKTMGESDQLIGDAFIDYRVRQLIETGKLEHTGQLKSMRDYSVRVEGSVKAFLTNLFKIGSEMDADGMYHYLLEQSNNELIVDTTPITQWQTIDLSNKMILSYDDNNSLAITWMKEGSALFSFTHTRVSQLEFKTDVYLDHNEQEVSADSVVIRFEDDISKILKIQLRPDISVLFL